MPSPNRRVLTHVGEALSYIPLLLLRLFPSTLPRFSDPDEEGRPILFIHGYLHSSWVWLFLRWRLSKARFGPLYFLNLTPLFAPLSTYVDQVAEMAKTIAKERGRTDLILVGHSMGGIVASLYATRLAPKGTVKKVITLASPFHGTPVADWGWGEGATQMRPNSPLLSELRSEIKALSSPPFFHLAALHDLIVIPGSSALLGQSPERERLFDHLGHVSLLFSPQVATQLSSWISQ